MKKHTPIIALLILLLALSLTACGKSQATTDAEDLINAIGEVTLDSGAMIEAAENAVAALSDEERETLTNMTALTAARDQYDALVIINDIDSLGEITEDSGPILSSIREKYDSASAGAQSAVTNYDALTAAEAKYTSLVEAAAEKLRAEGEAALATMRVEEDKVRKTSFYYPSSFPEYINDRSYALCYVGDSESSTRVRIVYDYVGKDWVFWKELIFLVDGNTYTRTINYFDIEHDNSGGQVWEYIDFTADEDDLKLFAAIAASDETIVRFEGDGGKRYDLTVSQEDKDSIRDVLAVYEYLRNQ